MITKIVAAVSVAILVAVIGFVGVPMLFGSDPRPPVPAAAVPSIGGNFTLVDQDGKTVTDQTYRGQYRLMFFGYTFCPDVCPTALGTVGTALEQLPPEVVNQITPIFVSVDPQRDTPETLKAYVSNFHPRTVGLTGSKEQIAETAKTFRVYYAKAETENGPYLMDHSSIIYFMGPDGKFITHFNHMTPPEQMAETIAKFVKAGAAS